MTGGAGFIGSHIVDALVARGTKTIIIDDLSSGTLDHVHPDAAVVQADVSDRAVIRRVADARPEVVIHAAAQVSVAASVERPEDDRRINLVGTENLLEGARRAKARRFVFISSGGAIYGETELASETTLPEPSSPYGIHKLAAEGYVRTSGISFAIARYANVYGPRQRTDLEGGVIAIFAGKLSRGEPVTIFGTGQQSRDFVFVKDTVDATLRMATAPRDGIWNVSTGTSTSILMLLMELEAVIARAVRVDHAPARLGDVRSSSLSSELLRRELDWRPRYSLREGVHETVADAVSLGSPSDRTRKLPQ